MTVLVSAGTDRRRNDVDEPRSGEVSSMKRVDNPSFELDPEVDSVLRRWRQQEEQRRRALDEIRASVAPTETEQQILERIARHAAELSGLSPALVHRAQEQRAHSLHRARHLVEEQVATATPRTAATTGVSRPSGADFCWVRTDAHHTQGFDWTARPEGPVFTGGPHGGPQHSWLEPPASVGAEFGVVSVFRVAAGRLPGSASGRWSSTPSVTIVGGVLANASRGLVPGALSSSRCSLRLDHHVFQVRPGPSGATAHIVGESHALIQIIERTGPGQTLHQPLPGCLDVPRAGVAVLDPEEPVWARLSITVEAQVEGSGSFLWCYPEVRVGTTAWPLLASP